MPRKKQPDKPKAKTVILRVPEEWHEFLRDKAHHDRTHIADLVRDALRTQFGLKEPSPPDEGNKRGLVYGAPAFSASLCRDRHG